MDDRDAFTCPITGELFMDPVHAADGFVYEHEAIVQWFQSPPNVNETAVRSPTGGVRMSKRLFRSFDFFQRYKSWCIAHDHPVPVLPPQFGEVDPPPSAVIQSSSPIVFATPFLDMSHVENVYLHCTDVPSNFHLQVRGEYTRTVVRDMFNSEGDPLSLHERMERANRPDLNTLMHALGVFGARAAPMHRQFFIELVNAYVEAGYDTPDDFATVPIRFTHTGRGTTTTVQLTQRQFHRLFPAYFTTDGQLGPCLAALDKAQLWRVVRQNNLEQIGQPGARRKSRYIQLIIDALVPSAPTSPP